jgi:pyruvate dehydrogenase E1 component beta subunit
LTNEDVPMPYAANLEKAALVNPAKIAAGVRKVLGR